MVVGVDTFVLSVLIGVIIGSIHAYFRYHETGRTAAIRSFLGWLLAFAITGVIATPVAQWIFQNVL